jgi:hypothetical protein
MEPEGPMSRIYRCDECTEEVDLPIMVLYPPRDLDPEDDEPDEDEDTEAHLCSWSCLAQWSTREAVEQACDAL